MNRIMPLSHAEALNLVGAALIMVIFLVIKTTRQLWRLKALRLWRRACVGFILNDREHLLEEMPKRTPSQHCLCCAIFPSRLTLDDWNIPNKKQILSYMMHTLIMHWFRIKRDIHRTTLTTNSCTPHYCNEFSHQMAVLGYNRAQRNIDNSK